MHVKFIRQALSIALLFSANVAAGPKLETQPEFAELFAKHGVRGSLLFCNERARVCEVHDRKRVHQTFVPASTFKIVNALIGLDAGAITDEHEIWPWDGTQRPVAAWNQDHDLASAMRVSTVWFYQELARRIGRERMQQGLTDLAYGNAAIGEHIDRFWLQGPLQIDSLGQLRLLKALREGKTPFSERAERTVREIIVRLRGEDFSVHAKTGWYSEEGETDIGWFVGWIEHGGGAHYFVLNIDMPNAEDAPKRLGLIQDLLQQRELLPMEAVLQ